MELWRELWAESQGTRVCPHIAADEKGCFCRCPSTHGFLMGAGDIISPGTVPPDDWRRLVCDTASLQLWCLDGERYANCMIYKEGTDG